jgi:hypothetical protein
MAGAVARDENVGYGTQDGCGFGEHEFDQARVFFRDGGETLRFRPWRDRVEFYEAALRFRDYFLRNDQDIAGLRLSAGCAQGVGEQEA